MPPEFSDSERRLGEPNERLARLRLARLINRFRRLAIPAQRRGQHIVDVIHRHEGHALAHIVGQVVPANFV